MVGLGENIREEDLFLESMMQQILNGTLRPGERLPTESELAAQYQIAKTNVHLGLKELERLGFLQIVPRHASYVTDIWDHVTLESLAAMIQYGAGKPEREAISAFLELREMLGCGVIRWMIRKPNPTHMRALKAHCAAMEHAAKAPNRDALWAELRAFLICMYTEIDNPIFPVLMRSVRRVAHRALELMGDYIDPDQAIAVYREVLDLVERGETAEAICVWTAWNDGVSAKYLQNTYGV